MCLCLLQIGPPIEMSINLLCKRQQLNDELAAWDDNYMVNNIKLNAYECQLYLMCFLSNADTVADKNLNQAAEDSYLSETIMIH
jgi:hypothetical protein